MKTTKNVLKFIENVFKKMQTLIGSLNFCCRAIVIGRPFIRHLIDSVCGLTKPYHHIRIKKDICLDLILWLKFLKQFNSILGFHDKFWVSNEDFQLFSDSAGGENLAFGLYFQGHWCHAK